MISDTSSLERTSNFSNLFSGVGTFRTGGTTVIASISFLIRSTFRQKNSPNSLQLYTLNRPIRDLFFNSRSFKHNKYVKRECVTNERDSFSSSVFVRFMQRCCDWSNLKTCQTRLLSESKFLGFSSALLGAVFQTFVRKREMERQIIVRLMMVFRFLRKTDCKRVN